MKKQLPSLYLWHPTNGYNNAATFYTIAISVYTLNVIFHGAAVTAHIVDVTACEEALVFDVVVVKSYTAVVEYYTVQHA